MIPLDKAEYDQRGKQMKDALIELVKKKWATYGAQPVIADLLVREVMNENPDLVRDAGEQCVHYSLYGWVCQQDDLLAERRRSSEPPRNLRHRAN